MWFALLLLFLGAGSHSESGTYPIDPISLRGLIDGSDLIVQGVAGPTAVIRPWPEDHTADYWCQISEVEIKLQEVILGEWSASTLTPFFPSGMGCPRSAEFDQGEMYLVFLSEERGVPGEDSNAETDDEPEDLAIRHRVIGLAYGAKPMTLERAAAYVAAIHAKSKIDQMEDMEVICTP